ncbi:MAG TPA: GAF domain-containing protein [Actinomycetes bacterium]|nr:GAF domain-containing protein [Actinomycetes bacterium]
MSEQQTDVEQPRPADLSAVTRLAAGNGLREAMKNRAGLEPIATAASGFIRQHFEADAASISLLRGEWYRALITVGDEIPGQRRHKNGAAYPARMYPSVTETLRDGRGYLASLGSDGGIPESQRFLKQFKKSTCMGAPIAYQGETVGELWVARVTGRPHYTGHDLAALLDLARQIGYRIGPAVKAQDAVNENWWPGEVRENGIVPGDLSDPTETLERTRSSVDVLPQGAH